MRRVITVSLNGNAFQVEEDACEVLAAYLDGAALSLAHNPDRQEIVADLEQAIADKCARYLTPHKTVVTRAELQQIITEMGPVDGESAQAGTEQASGPATAGAGAARAEPNPASGAPRRLYQISDGAVISGVCNGLGAYFSVDVTLIRVLSVVLAFLTGGVAVLIYLILMFVVPYASTSEEHAAAHGLPFNARVLVERAKRKYAQFAQTATSANESRPRKWSREWHRARAQMRQARRHARHEWTGYRGHTPGRGSAAAAPPGGAVPGAYGVQVVSATVLVLLGVVFAAFTIGWLVSFVSLVTTGAVFGWKIPGDVPLWVATVAMLVIYALVTAPIKAARYAARFPADHHPGSWVSAWDGTVGFVILITIGWYAAHHLPEIRDFVEHLRRVWQRG